MIRILPYLVAIVLLCVGLWYAYFLIDQHGYERCEKKLQAANLELAITYANQLTKAEGERDANQAIIDRLAAESRRVQVHIPVCPNSEAQDQNGTTGVFHNRVDESFARLQERGTKLFERCEAVNADAIKVNTVNQ